MSYYLVMVLATALMCLTGIPLNGQQQTRPWIPVFTTQNLLDAAGNRLTSTGSDIVSVGSTNVPYASSTVDVSEGTPWQLEFSYRTSPTAKGAALITIHTGPVSFGLYTSESSLTLTRDGVVFQKLLQDENWHTVSLASFPGYLSMAIDHKVVSAWSERQGFHQIEIGTKQPSADEKPIELKDLKLQSSEQASKPGDFPSYLPCAPTLGEQTLLTEEPVDIESRYPLAKYDSRSGRLVLAAKQAYVRLTGDQSVSLLPSIGAILKDKYEQDLGISIKTFLNEKEIADDIFTPTKRSSFLVPLEISNTGHATDRARVYVHQNQLLTGDLVQDILFLWDKSLLIGAPKIQDDRCTVPAQPDCTSIAIFLESRCLGSITPVEGTAKFSTAFLQPGEHKLTFLPLDKNGSIGQPVTQTVAIHERVAATLAARESRLNADSPTEWFELSLRPSTDAGDIEAFNIFLNGHLYEKVPADSHDVILGTAGLAPGIQFVSVQPVGRNGILYAPELVEPAELPSTANSNQREAVSKVNDLEEEVRQLDVRIAEVQANAQLDPSFGAYQHTAFPAVPKPSVPTYQPPTGGYYSNGTRSQMGSFQTPQRTDINLILLGKSITTKEIDAYVLNGRSASLFAESRGLVILKAEKLIELAQYQLAAQLSSQARKTIRTVQELTDDPMVSKMASSLMDNSH